MRYCCITCGKFFKTQSEKKQHLEEHQEHIMLTKKFSWHYFLNDDLGKVLMRFTGILFIAAAVLGHFDIHVNFLEVSWFSSGIIILLATLS